MTFKLKKEILHMYQKRYYLAQHRAEKTRILNDFCFDTGLSRKYANKILKGSIKVERSSKPGPKSKYQSSSFVIHLQILWTKMNFMCSKKMKEALPLWLPYYQGCSKKEKELFLSISPATIDRLLKPYKDSRNYRRFSSTSPSLIKNKIPIKLLDAEIETPGFIEADTVAHCGGSLMGEYANSLTMTDLFSGWTENRSCFTKSSFAVRKQIKSIEQSLPFDISGFASDNGSEFITHDLHKFFNEREEPVEFVRRRAYKKNDNAHVEQKNYTHVRQIFGYDRFEEKELVVLMNEIYQAYWNPLWNYFSPVMKLVSKERVGSKIKKRYDKPKTPYKRLLESEHLSQGEKRRLKQRFEGHNPFYLKQELDNKLKIFFNKVEMYKREKKRVS